MSIPPIRTFSITHPQVGFVEFSIPLMNPKEVESYLMRKTEHLPPAESFLLIQKLMKTANELWSGYALWLGDPVEAREELRKDKELTRWSAA